MAGMGSAHPSGPQGACVLQEAVDRVPRRGYLERSTVVELEDRLEEHALDRVAEPRDEQVRYVQEAGQHEAEEQGPTTAWGESPPERPESCTDGQHHVGPVEQSCCTENTGNGEETPGRPVVLMPRRCAADRQGADPQSQRPVPRHGRQATGADQHQDGDQRRGSRHLATERS